MVACRYGISLLVFNSTSHSFAALTRDSHPLYSLALEQLGVTLKSFRRLFKLHTHDVKAKLIFRINYGRKLFLPNRQLKEYLCKMGALHFIRDNAFSTYMLFAGREVRMVKNCDRGLGRGQHFQDRGHSFSPYGPTLSR